MITHRLKEEAYQPQTDIVLLVLLEITSSEGTIRVVRNTENVTFEGNTYEAIEFEFTPPEHTYDAPGSARLEIDNVSRLMVEKIETADEIDVRMILITDEALEGDQTPDVDEEFKLTNVEYDEKKVQGELTVDDYLFDRFPSGQFTPQHFRGIV